MSKTKQPIKFIYSTKFDSSTFTFTIKRLNVIKECSKYVSLEDGSRIETNYIYGLYTNNYYRNIECPLSREEVIYSLKPISKELKTLTKKETIEYLKSDIERDKKWLADKELNIKSLKDEITKKEEKLDRLLKL